jgi:hypothetical protein
MDAIEACEYCNDTLCGGNCRMHPGKVISLAGVGCISLIILAIVLRLVFSS